MRKAAYSPIRKNLNTEVSLFADLEGSPQFDRNRRSTLSVDPELTQSGWVPNSPIQRGHKIDTSPFASVIVETEWSEQYPSPYGKRKRRVGKVHADYLKVND